VRRFYRLLPRRAKSDRLLGTGLSRDVLSTYGPSFLAAGMTCIVATIVLIALRPVRPQVVAAE